MVEQPDIFTGARHPLCPECGDPVRTPHYHIRPDLEVLLAEFVRRQGKQGKQAAVTEREYLSLRELTLYSGWSVRTLQDFIRDPVDPLPAFQPSGGKVIVRKRDYDDWFTRRRQHGSAVGGIVRSVLADLRGGR